LTLRSRNESNMNRFKVLNNFFQNKYIILIFIGYKNRIGKTSTVIDVVDEFEIGSRYAYKLLEELEFGKFIIKKAKVQRNGVYYNNYIITETAKTELKEILKVITDIL